MKYFKRFRKGLIIGFIVIAIFSNFSFASPYKKQLDVVYNNIKIIIKGKEAALTEEPFIFEGRTYVPLRAIAEILGENVEWDASNNAIIIGEEELKSKEEGVVGIAEGIILPYKNFTYSKTPHMEFLTSKSVFYTGNMTKDSKEHIYVKQKRYDLENVLYQVQTFGIVGKSGQMYLLNGDYTKMTANFAVADSNSGNKKSTVSFYGDDIFLGEYSAEMGDSPQSIEIDLVGIEEFKIIIDDPSYNKGDPFYGILYDVKFHEINIQR